MPLLTSLTLTLPSWLADLVPADGVVAGGSVERMRLAILLSRENVARGHGGPFGALVCEQASGRVLAVGVNSVVALHSSVAHAEMLALMLAQQVRGNHSLADGPACELVTSCEPCAMCLGGILWSGVRTVLCGATQQDAQSIGFDEGPVDERSYAHLARRGIQFTRNLLRDEARGVFDDYRRSGGPIYNG